MFINELFIYRSRRVSLRDNKDPHITDLQYICLHASTHTLNELSNSASDSNITKSSTYDTTGEGDAKLLVWSMKDHMMGTGGSPKINILSESLGVAEWTACRRSWQTSHPISIRHLAYTALGNKQSILMFVKNKQADLHFKCNSFAKNGTKHTIKVKDEFD